MHILQLILVRSIFFMWGFATILNTATAYHFKALFALNYNVTTLVQLSYYCAYAFFSVPSARILRRYGYKITIEAGLLTSATGAFLFVFFSTLYNFYYSLFALFIIATGTVLLQVSLNPYITTVSKKNQDTKNLNLAQAFNSLGTVFAPLSAAIFIFGKNVTSKTAAIEHIYTVLGILLLLQALLFRSSNMPHIAKPLLRRSLYSALRYSHLIRGAIAIFFYVGAEVGVGFFLISLFKEFLALSSQKATELIIVYWLLAMLGRFLSPFLLRYVKDKRLLAIYAVSAIGALSTLLIYPFTLLIAILPIIGLFNSIMFPTIFALSIRKLGTFVPLGAGIICFSIIGGALLPKLQGYLADVVGLRYCFIVPLISYIYILYFAIKGHAHRRTF